MVDVHNVCALWTNNPKKQLNPQSFRLLG